MLDYLEGKAAMKRSTMAILLLSSTLTMPVMAFETTTDLVVRTLYASQQVTSSFSNDKIVRAAKGDAASFVASDGAVRGAFIESALQQIRAQYPTLKLTDLELAKAILAY